MIYVWGSGEQLIPGRGFFTHQSEVVASAAAAVRAVSISGLLGSTAHVVLEQIGFFPSFESDKLELIYPKSIRLYKNRTESGNLGVPVNYPLQENTSGCIGEGEYAAYISCNFYNLLIKSGFCARANFFEEKDTPVQESGCSGCSKEIVNLNADLKEKVAAIEKTASNHFDKQENPSNNEITLFIDPELRVF